MKSVLIVAVLVLSFSSIANAGRGDDAGFGRMMPERVLDQLGLSPEQKAKLREIRKSAMEEHRKNKDSLQPLREELKRKMASESESEESIRKTFAQLQERENLEKKKGLDRMLEVRAVLNPAQRKELSNLLERRGRRGRPDPSTSSE